MCGCCVRESPCRRTFGGTGTPKSFTVVPKEASVPHAGKARSKSRKAGDHPVTVMG